MFGKINMFDLGLSKHDREIYESDRIGYNKKINSIIKQSKGIAKLENCYYCRKSCSSFCNSHSVPQFCLKNIATNGDLYYSNTLVELPMLDGEKGVKEAGTFQIICRECDSQIFKEYEDPDNYAKIPSGKMLAQIAMKNYLRIISKRNNEIALYDILSEKTGNDVSAFQTVNRLDLNEYVEGFLYAKKASQKKWNDYFYLGYYEKLDYVVPIAFQSNLVLISDFEGKTINDIYNASPDYHTKDIHICIFPLDGYSIVMMFNRSDEKRYSSFYRQFGKLSLADKLSAINYIIFCYSEDIFIYKGIDSNALHSKALQEVSQQTFIALVDNPFSNPLEVATHSYDLAKRSTIPNFLEEKYKVR